MSTPVSFENDIKPILQQYMGQMMWRFDMTLYETVKANAADINYQIQSGSMPPQPWDNQLSAEQKQMFADWVYGKCQP